jgi:hypothetical protein
MDGSCHTLSNVSQGQTGLLGRCDGAERISESCALVCHLRQRSRLHFLEAFLKKREMP